MSENVILEDKLVGKIKGNFYVPAYQRGYRWTDSQIKTLLDDLWENAQNNPTREYCLQPIVVRKRSDDDYELIDGQQRFTSILILLKNVAKRNLPFNAAFSLEYETRKDTAKFLDNINESDAHSNIDFFHIYCANECINQWISSSFGDDVNAISTSLFQLINYLINKVKVIWYEVGEDEDSVALFTRLNIGRIQLTNAELVRALLLKSDNTHESMRYQMEISIQWDNIEKQLRSDNDELWYFLTKMNPSKYPTRIELLFDMMSGKTYEERETYFTFFWFEEEIKRRERSEQSGVDSIWKEIQENFLRIREWYQDSVYYHKIGYLISSGAQTMQQIFLSAQNKRKSEFIASLDSMIASSINFEKNEESYSELSYQDNYSEISKLLLLFNVESIVKENVYQRFPFSKYNTREWTLEHIHAQQSEGLKKQEDQIEWIKMHLPSVKTVSKDGENCELISQMEEIISHNEISSRNSFMEIWQKVCSVLSENDDVEYIHSLANMALLTRGDNAALNNSTFDVKRNKIVEMDRNGAFIPYCTKMVFLKYYTPSSENQIHFWGQNDRNAYLDAIKEMLTPYLQLVNRIF